MIRIHPTHVHRKKESKHKIRLSSQPITAKGNRRMFFSVEPVIVFLETIRNKQNNLHLPEPPEGMPLYPRLLQYLQLLGFSWLDLLFKAANMFFFVLL